MSRIGRKPIPIPSGVSVETVDGGVRVKGPQGHAHRAAAARAIGVRDRGRQGLGARAATRTRPTRALHGLARALIANMVHGRGRAVRARSSRSRASATARTSRARSSSSLLGFSHPVELAIPEGLKVVGRQERDDPDRGDRPPAGRPVRGRPARGSARRSRTRARASATSDERVRRKVGKAGAAALRTPCKPKTRQPEAQRRWRRARARVARPASRAATARAHRVPQRASTSTRS